MTIDNYFWIAVAVIVAVVGAVVGALVGFWVPQCLMGENSRWSFLLAVAVHTFPIGMVLGILFWWLAVAAHVAKN